jgi:N-acetylneuraminic acid mutarotase
MKTGRYYHTATLLPDGRVLVAGGLGASGSLASAEIFDPGTGMWTETKNPLNAARYYHTATLLPDGRVLVSGGVGGGASAELYNPGTDAWTGTSNPMNTPRSGHTATLLKNGAVLVAGGYYFDGTNHYLASAEIYTPGTGSWDYTPTPMDVARNLHTAVLLGDGRVLVAGGWDNTNYHFNAQIFDPVSKTWANTDILRMGRSQHTATVLKDGKVLVAGGVNSKSSLPTAELYGGPKLQPLNNITGVLQLLLLQ